MSVHSLEISGKHTISLGPWGGDDGFHWDDGVFSTIRQLEIAHGECIDSIRIEYDNNGASIWSERHGGSGGAKIDKMRLDWPDEYLTSLHGHYGTLQEWGLIIVRSLAFESNKRTYGPYGTEKGSYFTLPMIRSKIVGFHGKCDLYLDSIGVHLKPLSKPISSNSIIPSQPCVLNGTGHHDYSMIQGSIGTSYDFILAIRKKNDYNKNSPPIDLSRQSSNESKNEIASVIPNKIERVPSENVHGVVTSGPWGGNGGSLFDDGVYDGIRQIILSRNVGIISIRVCYEQNGKPIWGNKNGGTGGFKHDKIPFNYPSEHLTHITGYHGPAMILGPDVIKSLTFHTTNGKYGPYGDEQGNFFSTKLKEGSMIVGIHGKKGLFVDAIGVHVLEGKVVHSSTSYNQTSASNNQIASSSNKVNNRLWPFKVGKRGQIDEVF